MRLEQLHARLKVLLEKIDRGGREARTESDMLMSLGAVRSQEMSVKQRALAFSPAVIAGSANRLIRSDQVGKFSPPRHPTHSQEEEWNREAYAGSAGLVLSPTTADHRLTLKLAVEKLNAGGTTAGGAGIKLAYKTALENFIEDGNNRAILATDGDFNVGVTSESELVDLIKEQATSGVFLTVLGFGTGNFQDARMEALSNHGNGNYAYIDGLAEARKVFLSELTGTLYTVAKDVKFQIEFNPAYVHAYRLIGYENRKLANRDFADDKKDAGEAGSGHQVTALYELMPVGYRYP